MTRSIDALIRDDRGASLIEMALIMPFLGSLVIGVTDLSTAYSAKLQLVQAASRAVEKVQQYQADEDTYATLKAEAAAAAGVGEDDVTIDYWLECNGVRQPDYDSSCTGGQATARWVTVQVVKTYVPMFASRAWPGANADGSFTLRGRAGLRTQ